MAGWQRTDPASFSHCLPWWSGPTARLAPKHHTHCANKPNPISQEAAGPPVSTWRQAPVEASHTRAVQSLERVTTVWPSWVISTWFTAARQQRGARVGCQVLAGTRKTGGHVSGADSQAHR